MKCYFTNFLPFFAAQDDDANKADQEVIADDQDNADQGSSSRQGHRQFVGFCNPQDHVEMDMPSSTIHNNSNNSRKHKKFLPQVLKNDPEDHDSVSFIITNSVFNDNLFFNQLFVYFFITGTS